MTQDETRLSKSAVPMVNPAEAGVVDPWDDTFADPVTETLKQTFPASDPPSWWAGRSSPSEGTQPALSRR